jgi:hypothetical protein
MLALGLCLAQSIRLGWKCKAMANVMAYYDTATINYICTKIIVLASGTVFTTFQNLKTGSISSKVSIWQTFRA